MFKGLGNWFKEALQDIDGYFSAKRMLMLMFAVAFLVITLYVTFNGVSVKAGAQAVYSIPDKTLDFLKTAINTCVEAIKWLMVGTSAERIPQVTAAFKGKGETPTASAEPTK